ncbi:MAG: hypothetical protein VB138_07235, partial [Burkholderia sp.]
SPSTSAEIMSKGITPSSRLIYATTPVADGHGFAHGRQRRIHRFACRIVHVHGSILLMEIEFETLWFTP